MIFVNVNTANEFMDCSKLSLKALEFQLRDNRHRLMKLHSSTVSFSLIFDVLNLNS